MLLTYKHSFHAPKQPFQDKNTSGTPQPHGGEVQPHSPSPKPVDGGLAEGALAAPGVAPPGVWDRFQPVPIVALGSAHPVFRHQQALMKLESCNVTGSIKDKNAAYLIESAAAQGLLPPGGTIIESSSGNFGIALASVGAALGYQVVIVIDAKTPPPTVRMLTALGARLERVSLSLADASGSMQKARMAHAKQLAEQIPGSYYPCQHRNLDNPTAHYEHTAREILAGLTTMPDAVFVGVSTCGQITGISRYLREHAPQTKVVGVDVAGSVVMGGTAGPYKMTGLGLSFVPPNYDPQLVDYGYMVPDPVSFNMTRRIAKTEGLLLGASTGAIAAAAAHYLEHSPPGTSVLLVNPDRGDRYLETVYHDAWMVEQGLPLLSPEELQQAISRLEQHAIAATVEAS